MKTEKRNRTKERGRGEGKRRGKKRKNKVNLIQLYFKCLNFIIIADFFLSFPLFPYPLCPALTYKHAWPVFLARLIV